jgi:hypothetical protein
MHRQLARTYVTSKVLPSTPSVVCCLVLLCLFQGVAHASTPTDAELDRLLRAYPAGRLYEAGFVASLNARSATSTQQSRAACIRSRVDGSVFDQAARRAAREHFTDGASLRAIAAELESPGGRKLIASLLAVKPGPNGSPIFPDAEYTPAELARLERFQATEDFASFRHFANGVGSQIELDAEYRSMMNGVREGCRQ